MKLAIVLTCLGVFGCTAEVVSAQTSFSATLTCGGSKAGPITKKSVDLGPDGQSLLINQQTCTWTGFKIGGVDVKKSLMTAVATIDATKKVSGAKGYDWGTLANGDHFYAEWEETALHSGNGISDYGIWRIVSGTGTLKGLSGTAVYICPIPKQATAPPPIVQFAFVQVEVKCSMQGQLDLGSAAPAAQPPPH